MKPNQTLITIENNITLIKQFLREVILAPRANMLKWAKLTNQTPNLKIGYPGQHLASLITGIQGTGTGARGDDLADGTEVKSCSRIDQLDKCESCKGNVMRAQTVCPSCGSEKIKRTNDSKWLIGVRNEKELSMYLNDIPRMLFIISDYPCFDKGDYSVMRISSYEIWNQSPRAEKFRKILQDYYNEIYLSHISVDAKKTPAPKNFWPYSYQFYLSNPIKTFECIITDIDSANPEIEVTHYVEPKVDRSALPSEELPISLLNQEERNILKKKGIELHSITLNEEAKSVLPLRNTSKAQPQNTSYKRKSASSKG